MPSARLYCNVGSVCVMSPSDEITSQMTFVAPLGTPEYPDGPIIMDWSYVFSIVSQKSSMMTLRGEASTSFELVDGL